MSVFILLPSSIQASPFYDVQGPAIDYVYKNNIMTGVGENYFGCQANLKRGDFVYLLYRIHRDEPSSRNIFSDIPREAYYAKAVHWAVGKGIIYGRSVSIFDPNGSLTIEETAAIMERYTKLYMPKLSYSKEPLPSTNHISPWAYKAVMRMKNYFPSISNPQRNITREEIAQVIYNIKPLNHVISKKDDGGEKNKKKFTSFNVQPKPVSAFGLSSDGIQLSSGRKVSSETYNKLKKFHEDNMISLPEGDKKLLFDRINKIRRNKSLPILKYSNLLEGIAEKRVMEAARIKINAGIYENPHKRTINGESFASIMGDFGYPKSQFFLGENVTTRRSTVQKRPSYSEEEAFRNLYNSPDHLENMLSPNFTHVGIAQYNDNHHHLWLQLFIKDELDNE